VQNENNSLYPYLRKSRALGDPDDPKILDHHQEALERLALREDLVIPPERYIREIGSAETISGRPRFKALLEYWERLPYDAGGIVLVTELERLSRGSMQERGRIADALARADIHILTLHRRYDLRNTDDRLMAQIQWIFAEHELGKYKERKALKLEKLLREGRTPNGREPFGYRWDPEREDFVPHPEQFTILQRWCEEIFSLSIDRIAARWGVGRWVVYQTLTNPTICGWPARRTGPHHGERECSRKHVRLKREDWRWPERQGTYEPACSRDRWEQIQVVLRQRAHRRANPGSDENGWCRDVLRFVSHPECSAYLATDSNYRNRPDDPSRWTYEAGRSRPTKASPEVARVYIPRYVVHAAAEAALARIFDAPELLRESLEEHRSRQALRAVHTAAGRDLETLTAERGRAERQLDDLLRRELDEESEIQRASIARLRAVKEKDIQRLTTEIQAVAATAGPEAPDLDGLLPFVTDKMPRLQEWWPEVEPALRRRIVKGFIRYLWAAVESVPGQVSLCRRVVGVEWLDWVPDSCTGKR